MENVGENNTEVLDKTQDLNMSTLENNESLVVKKINEIFVEYMLSEIQCLAAFKFIKESFLNQNSTTEKVKNWVINKVNNKPLPKNASKYQIGCPDVCPGITIQGFHDPKNFDFISELLNNIDIIKEELLQLREINKNEESVSSGFQPYKSPNNSSDIKSKDGIGSLAHDSGEWNVFYLFLHELKFESNCKRCPKTVELIEKLVPRQY
jgi:aspartate beta-hydroxylase